MKKVTIYTDGACSGNPGPGGWGAILMCENSQKEISGASPNTTNNIMEITAVLEALKLLKFECEVEIFSDSAYVVNSFKQGWIENWQKNNWKTANKEPVKNRELWEELYALTKKHKVKFNKVKGHSDNEWNNRCDFLATTAIKTLGKGVILRIKRKENKMKVIGITGASGSGKTTICQILKQREDIKIIDADKMVKEMTNAETQYFLAIKKAFQNENIIFEDGTLNRAKLAGLIYGDKNKLETLNRITFEHLIPKIVGEIKHAPKQIKTIIIDAPLLFEAGLDQYCDCTVTLQVPDLLKIKRICARDNIIEKVAKDRLNIQKNNEFYQQKSDYVIINDEKTTIQNLEEEINRIIDEI